MILKRLFLDLNDFSSVVPGVDANLSFQCLNSHAMSAYKRIVNIITIDVYNKIVDLNNSTYLDYLRQAIGNLTMANDTAFDVIRKRKADVDIYKSEQEAIRRVYYENYYNAMDSLIQSLGDDASLGWSNTPYCQLIQKLQIKSAEEFDLLYNIDSSYLFFFRCIPIQLEILEEEVGDYFERAQGRDNILSLLKRALAKKIVAVALFRFDLLEIPAIIRNLFSDSSLTRSTAPEQERLLTLATQLNDQSSNLLKDIDLMLTESSTSVETETSFNEPDDLILLMP